MSTTPFEMDPSESGKFVLLWAGLCLNYSWGSNIFFLGQVRGRILGQGLLPVQFQVSCVGPAQALPIQVCVRLASRGLHQQYN